MIKIVSLPQAIECFLEEYQKQVCNSLVLDVGCGGGFYTGFFAKNGNNVIGVDIKKHKMRGSQNFIFMNGDAYDLPFRNDIFDLVVSFDVIEHIDNDQRMVQEIYRVLKNNGKILIGTPNRERLTNKIKSILGKHVQYPCNLGYDPDLDEDIVHVREYASAEMEKLLLSCGFRNAVAYPLWIGIPSFPGLMDVPKGLVTCAQYLFFEAEK